MVKLQDEFRLKVGEILKQLRVELWDKIRKN